MNFDRPQDNNSVPEQNRFQGNESGPELKHESKELAADATIVQQIEQKIEQSTKEKQLELAIRGAEDFPKLYTILQEAGGLQGHLKFYPAEELIRLIGKVSQGLDDPRVLTSTGGLRSKVTDLLQIQTVRESLAADPKEAIRKRMADFDLSITDTRMRLESATGAERETLQKKLDERMAERFQLEQQLGAQN